MRQRRHFSVTQLAADGDIGNGTKRSLDAFLFDTLGGLLSESSDEFQTQAKGKVVRC